MPALCSTTPLQVDLWLDAAAWEYEGNQNMLNARALLQRALRLNGHSQKLWCEYLRLEMLYARQIRERHAVLGLENNANAAQKAFLEGSIASVVVDSAMKAIPEDLGFRVALARVGHEFGGMQAVLDDIYDSIATDFEADPDGCSALAERFPLEAGEHNERTLEQGCEVFEEGVARSASPGMWEAYVQWVLSHLQAATRDDTQMTAKLLKLLSRIEAASSMTLSLYDTWVQTLIRQGDTSTASQVLDRGLKASPLPCMMPCMMYAILDVCHLGRPSRMRPSSGSTASLHVCRQKARFQAAPTTC